MIIRPLSNRWISLILIGSLLTGGCASISGTEAVTEGSPVVFQSYDLPDTLDFHAVVHAVELAFAHTLSTTPRIVEGSVPSPLPAEPASFTVEERRVHFERLGVVTIHEVGCAGSLASVHAWVTDRSEIAAPHRYTGCIQLYAGAYRVQLIDSKLVLKSSHGLSGSADSRLKYQPNLLSRLAKGFLEQIAEAREVTDSYTTASFPPEKSAGSSVMRGQGQEVEAASPLVCLAPRYEAAAVRTQHGGGQVIQMLEQGSLTVVADSVDTAYFRVKTTEGLVGWVNRSDVRRLPCPIG